MRTALEIVEQLLSSMAADMNSDRRIERELETVARLLRQEISDRDAGERR